MVNLKAWYTQRGGLDKETHYLLFSSFYVRKAYMGSFSMQPWWGEIKGFSLCQQGPKLTHLLLADDSLLFCRSTLEECGKVLGILNQYEVASGKKVNKNKTAIFFSTSMPEYARQEIKSILWL